MPRTKSMINATWLHAGLVALLSTLSGAALAEPAMSGPAITPTAPIATQTTPERAMFGVVSGHVVDPDGLPVAGARVTRLGPGGGEAVTDQFGEFRLELTHDANTPISVVIEKRSGTEVLQAIEQVHLTRDGDHADLPGVVLRSTCEPQWTVGLFGGVSTGVQSIGSVNASVVFDDGTGSGPALYVGGEFFAAGNTAVNNIARWDGSSWSPLGSGMNSQVIALAVFDDGSGSGPALYAGGNFFNAGGVPASRIARWDGASWSPVGSGVGSPASPSVLALTVFDDGSGSGPALYVGGFFTTAGGLPASNIAKWDGTSWSALGTGITSNFSATVRALAVFDDGSGAGPALYAGGEFTTAGGVAASNIARWDGSSWSPLGSGMNGRVLALRVFDDGGDSGPALYVGGRFTTAGGLAANSIARWNGSLWSRLGTGVSGSNAEVAELTVFDDGGGAGPALYAGGLFATAGGVTANRIAKWDGTSWSPLGSGVSRGSTSAHVNALTVFDDGGGAGPALYVGGFFTTAGGVYANHIARWSGSSWSPLGSGVRSGSGLNDEVHALVVFDDGSGAGPALYAGGSFTTAGGLQANRIARWDGFSWSPVGSGMNFRVYSLAVFDDGSGSGPALYAGGSFFTAGGVPASSIAKWDGSSWSPLGSGMSRGSAPAYVYALAVFDNGSGSRPVLYAGGEFTTAGGEAASNIAVWDGTSWSPLGSGTNGRVFALTVFDDGGGAGPALYAGGDFTTAGVVEANNIARWNGTSWSPLGLGLNNRVRALTVFDDGGGANSGPALFAGGGFGSAGGVAARRIAKWNGLSWSPLGSGVGSGLANDEVLTLTVFDDGGGASTGPTLFAGGRFLSAGGVAASRIAKWDGTSWSSLESGMSVSNVISALTVFDDGVGAGSGPALYLGGQFSTAGGSPSSRIARWEGCQDPIPACPCDVDNDGVQTIADYFVYLTDFFAQLGGPGSADLDGDNTVTIDDFFIFLNCLPAIAASELCP